MSNPTGRSAISDKSKYGYQHFEQYTLDEGNTDSTHVPVTGNRNTIHLLMLP